MGFQVIPAINLRGGRVVRLPQSGCARETVVMGDPLTLAQRYVDEGAEWLHVLDLDDARRGQFANLAVIEAIARTCALKLQAGGDVRTTDDLRRLYAAGVTRALVRGVTVENPFVTAIWISQFGAERMVLVVEACQQAGAWRVPMRGSDPDSPVQLERLAEHYVRAGAQHVLCTDIARDATLGGFNEALYREVHRIAPGFVIQAAGGVCSLDDIRKVRAAGARAVVLGRALLDHQFRLRDALKC